MASRTLRLVSLMMVLTLSACQRPAPAPESTQAVATPIAAVTPSPEYIQAVASATPAVVHGETPTPVPADQEDLAVTPAPVMLNPATFRVLTQTDAFNVNKPADERANGRDEAGDRLGAALVSADFNGDGYDDLAAGATGEASAGAPRTGAVFLWQGSGGGPSLGRYEALTPQKMGSDQEGSRFGAALAAGDVNGDGLADLVVGAPGETVQGAIAAGTAYLVEGSAWRPEKSHSITQNQAESVTAAGDAFGAAVASADFDGDGHADVIVGAPGKDSGGVADAGSITLFRGSEDWLDKGLQLDQTSFDGRNEPADAFGAATTTGDFNGDGYADLAVAAPGKAGGAGVVYVLDGSGRGLARGRSYSAAQTEGAPITPGPLPGAEFGASLAAGDFNGDDFSDLAVAAPAEASGEGATPGAIYLLLGSKEKLRPAGRWTANPPAGEPSTNARFVRALAAGDLDHDGKADLVAGAPVADNAVSVEETDTAAADSTTIGGTIYVFAGAEQGLLPGRRLTVKDWGDTGAPAGSFGSSLVLGNMLGTGAADLVVGVPLYTTHDAAASEQVQSGALYFAGGLPHLPLVTHGALVGAVTDSSARIWARADQSAALQLKIRRSGAAAWFLSPAVSLTPETDFTGVISLTDLQPDTRYDYVVTLNGVDQPERGGVFKTFKPHGQPLTYRFALGADMYYPEQPFVIFDGVAEKQPDFMLVLGDQIYADGPDRVADDKAGYERKYKENWADPSFSSFARRFPTFMIWDDHEIDNDWDIGSTGRYQNARLAYDEYQSNHNPAPVAPGENYYTFSVGNTDFFVLDTRTYRSENGSQAGPDKTMLGAVQKEALKNWLLTSPAAFKFIVTSVPFNQHGNTGSVEEGQDNWNNFQNERAEIFDLIRDHCIPGVMLLTGDQHWAGMFRLPYAQPIELYEFMPNPLAVPLRPMTKSNDPEILFKDNTRHAYGLFDIDTTVQPPRLHHEILDRDNKIMYQIDLTADDILPPGVCTPK